MAMSCAGLKGGAPRRGITLEEVKQHRTRDDAWTAIRGKVRPGAKLYAGRPVARVIGGSPFARCPAGFIAEEALFSFGLHPPPGRPPLLAA